MWIQKSRQASQAKQTYVPVEKRKEKKYIYIPIYLYCKISFRSQRKRKHQKKYNKNLHGAEKMCVVCAWLFNIYASIVVCTCCSLLLLFVAVIVVVAVCYSQCSTEVTHTSVGNYWRDRETWNVSEVKRDLVYMLICILHWLHD